MRPETCATVGAGQECMLSDAEKESLQVSLGITNVHRGLRFQRILLCGVRFSTDTYGRSEKKCDSAVYLRDGSKCVIQFCTN